MSPGLLSLAATAACLGMVCPAAAATEQPALPQQTPRHRADPRRTARQQTVPRRTVPPRAQSLPAVADVQQVVEIRIQGNVTVPDEEVLALAGVAVGDALQADDLDRIRQRLLASGRFADAQVQRRYRSLTRFDQVVLLITVREKLGVAGKLLALPAIHYNEDEGFSGGVRLSADDLLGTGEFLSLPLSWGGVDSAALEVRWRLGGGLAVGLSAGARRFENPHFEIDDERLRLGAFVRYRARSPVWLEAHARLDDVSFGTLDETLRVIGLRVGVDTRSGTAFPRDAVLLSAGWERLDASGRAVRNRWLLEAAGYRRLLGRLVLAARAEATLADGALPPYEKRYVGGRVSLRGSRAGRFLGDNALLGSVELRLPFGPALSPVRYGVTAFWDTALVWDDGVDPADVPLHHGVGGGLFAILPLLRLNLDVASDTHGSTRMHFGFGFRF